MLVGRVILRDRGPLVFRFAPVLRWRLKPLGNRQPVDEALFCPAGAPSLARGCSASLEGLTTDLSAVVLVCSLKKSPAASSAEKLGREASRS